MVAAVVVVEPSFVVVVGYGSCSYGPVTSCVVEHLLWCCWQQIVVTPLICSHSVPQRMLAG